MKHLIIAVMVVLAMTDCKKKNVTPADPNNGNSGTGGVPTNTCVAAASMDGLWFYNTDDATQTMQVKFIKNNCPDSPKNNTYSPVGLEAILKAYLKPGKTYTMKDTTFIFDEVKNNGPGYQYTVERGNTGTWYVLVINVSTSTFIKNQITLYQVH